jgi:uroporphyrinogen decarboxylase
MNNRDKFLAVVQHKAAHNIFWPGNLHEESRQKLYKIYGVNDFMELGIKMGSPLHWVQPEECGAWTRKDYPQFDPNDKKDFPDGSHGPIFEDVDDLDVINSYHWPTADDCDFTQTVKEIDRAKAAGQAVICSMWGSIFSNTWNFFGMSECLIRMAEAPETVEAVTRHLTDFYLAANEKLFALAGDKIDMTLIGIDLGSQRDLLISPAYNERFTLPYIKAQLDQSHRHGYYAAMHSCGSIWRLIPRLIEMGVDVLHPIQALATGMSAEELKQYNGKIVFMGGVDTQEILVHNSPEQVKAEVRRLKSIFGPNYIVSASHEAPPDNIPPENFIAMAEEAPV